MLVEKLAAGDACYCRAAQTPPWSAWTGENKYVMCYDLIPVDACVCGSGVAALWCRLVVLCEGKHDGSFSEKQGFAFLLTALRPRYRVLAGTIWLFCFLRIWNRFFLSLFHWTYSWPFSFLFNSINLFLYFFYASFVAIMCLVSVGLNLLNVLHGAYRKSLGFPWSGVESVLFRSHF